jgi:hypothetical protein
MRVLRDVVVDRVERDELLAISHVPGVIGELMTLDLTGAAGSLELKVRVTESRPVIIEGAVKHRIRLGLLQPERPAAPEMEFDAAAAVADAETRAEAV